MRKFLAMMMVFGAPFTYAAVMMLDAAGNVGAL